MSRVVRFSVRLGQWYCTRRGQTWISEANASCLGYSGGEFNLLLFLLFEVMTLGGFTLTCSLGDREGVEFFL
jgi:hypothetical protein